MAQIKLQTKPAVPEIIREGIIGAMGGGLIALILKGFSGEWGRISDLVLSVHNDNFLGKRVGWFLSVMLTSALCGLLLGVIYTALSRALPVNTAKVVTWIIAGVLLAAALILLPLGVLARIALLIIGLIATFTATQA